MSKAEKKWKGGVWQYLIDHSKIDKKGTFLVKFYIPNEKEFWKRVRARQNNQYKRANVQVLEDKANKRAKKKTRTNKQNNSIHKYLSMVSEELQEQGHTMQDVVKSIRRAEIVPTMNALKEVVWKPIQEITYGKKSTTELETKEVDKIYQVMSMWLAKEFGISLPFPSDVPEMYADQSQNNN